MSSTDVQIIAQTSLPSFKKDPIVSVLPIAWDGDVRTDPSSRWRPRLHFTAQRGWINDPCGPGYDPISTLR